MTHSTEDVAIRTLLGAASGVLTATAVVATLLMPAPVQAQQRGQEAPMLVSYPTDASMTCDQLAAEIVRTAEIAGIAADNIVSAENQGAMANAATSVAVSGALYSGALGRVPGLGMFANAAGGMARRNAEARARAEAERVRVAEQRHTLMTGIYQGRQCGMAAAPVPVAAPVFDPPPVPPVQTDAADQPTVPAPAN